VAQREWRKVTTFVYDTIALQYGKDDTSLDVVAHESVQDAAQLIYSDL